MGSCMDRFITETNHYFYLSESTEADLTYMGGCHLVNKQIPTEMLRSNIHTLVLCLEVGFTD